MSLLVNSPPYRAVVHNQLSIALLSIINQNKIKTALLMYIPRCRLSAAVIGRKMSVTVLLIWLLSNVIPKSRSQFIMMALMSRSAELLAMRAVRFKAATRFMSTGPTVVRPTSTVTLAVRIFTSMEQWLATTPSIKPAQPWRLMTKSMTCKMSAVIFHLMLKFATLTNIIRQSRLQPAVLLHPFQSKESPKAAVNSQVVTDGAAAKWGWWSIDAITMPWLGVSIWTVMRPRLAVTSPVQILFKAANSSIQIQDIIELTLMGSHCRLNNSKPPTLIPQLKSTARLLLSVSIKTNFPVKQFWLATERKSLIMI